MLWDAQDCEAQLFERSPYYVELLSILLGEVPSKCLTPVGSAAGICWWLCRAISS